MATDRVQRPARFTATIGGFMGPAYEVRLEGEALVYRRAPGAYKWGTPERIIPSDEKWRAFSRVLDRERVWEWAPEYPNPGVMDGTMWSIEIEWGARSIETGGDNNYPSDADPKAVNVPAYVESQRFIRLMRAVSRLVGRPFR